MIAKVIPCLLALTSAPFAARAAPVPPQFLFPFGGKTQHVVVYRDGGQPTALPSRCLALVGAGRSTYEPVTLCTRDEKVVVHKDGFGTKDALDAALEELGGPGRVVLFDADQLALGTLNLNVLDVDLLAYNAQNVHLHGSDEWQVLLDREEFGPGVLCRAL